LHCAPAFGRADGADAPILLWRLKPPATGSEEA
jgi:hypothetical protein